ncbi:hypothetical protein, partial [Nocardia carnea]|uniref:hypothetical protein n=1 Tax=Nocardia carnea TaxID=37328 RepID=UPI0024566F75
MAKPLFICPLISLLPGNLNSSRCATGNACTSVAVCRELLAGVVGSGRDPLIRSHRGGGAR